MLLLEFRVFLPLNVLDFPEDFSFVRLFVCSIELLETLEVISQLICHLLYRRQCLFVLLDLLFDFSFRAACEIHGLLLLSHRFDALLQSIIDLSHVVCELTLPFLFLLVFSIVIKSLVIHKFC